MAPVIQKLVADGFPITTIDADIQADVTSQYGVETLPTFILLVEEVESKRLVGVVAEEQIRKLFTKIPDYKIW